MNANIENMISINDAPKLIATVGNDVTVVLLGEPGIGKTNVLRKVHETLGADDYIPIYIDCPVIGDGDLGMRIPDRDTKQLETYISSLFPMQSGKKLIIMLDEIGKVSKMMGKVFTRLMLDRVLMDIKLPEGSIVFATSNLASDGVGDFFEGHVGNRVAFVEVAKPNHKEWLTWATNNGVSAVTKALVSIMPKLFQSYRTLSADRLRENPHIYNPTGNNKSFASPRSMYKADLVAQMAGRLGDRVTRATLCGLVGEATAELFSSFIKMQQDIIPLEQILLKPESVPVPTNAGAILMTLFTAADSIETHDELSTFLTYVNRITNVEFRDVFYSNLCESERTIKMAMQNKVVMQWYQENYKIMSH